MELAKLYEGQGYFQDALDVYDQLEKELKEQGGKIDPAGKRIHEARQRIQGAMANGRDVPWENKIETLLEQWLELLILKKRLSRFRRIKSRF